MNPKQLLTRNLSIKLLNLILVLVLTLIVIVLGPEIYSHISGIKKNDKENTLLKLNSQLKRIDTLTNISSTEKTELVILKESLDTQNENIARTIDLMNIVLLGGGGVIALFAIVVTLQLNKWDNKDKEIELFKKSVEENNEKMDDFFTRFSRGLSKYYSQNYSSACNELIELEQTYRDQHLFDLSDVYFNLGKSYFRRIDTLKEKLNSDDEKFLSKAIMNYYQAARRYEREKDVPDSCQAYASLAVAYSYRSNVENIDEQKQKEYKNKAIQNAEIALSKIDYYARWKKDKDKDKYENFVLPSKYTIACAYAVLHRFEKTGSPLKDIYLEKAISNLSIVYNKNLVRRDYILNDVDWKHMIDPERFAHDKDELIKFNNARLKLVKCLGDFFRKKYSRFEIAKLYIRIYELFSKAEIKLDDGKFTIILPDANIDLFKKKALERLKRSYDSGLVSKYQVKESAFKHCNKSNELFEFYPKNNNYELFDKVNSNFKDRFGNENNKL